MDHDKNEKVLAFEFRDDTEESFSQKTGCDLLTVVHKRSAENDSQTEYPTELLKGLVENGKWSCGLLSPLTSIIVNVRENGSHFRRNSSSVSDNNIVISGPAVGSPDS